MGDLTLLPVPNTTRCWCKDLNMQNFYTYGPPYVNNSGNCNGNPPVQVCWTTTQFAIGDVDSDGIVQASSAMALPGASAQVLMAGDSHFQLVNSPRLKTALLGLWNAGHGDPFFITNEK